MGPGRHKVEPSSISRCIHKFRFYLLYQGLETGKTTIKDSNLMNSGESGAVDAGTNDEYLRLRDNLGVLETERENLSSNIDKVYTERGRMKEDKEILTGRVSELNERVTALTNDFAQPKSETDIKNYSLVGLE